jgi:hypothetical protein
VHKVPAVESACRVAHRAPMKHGSSRAPSHRLNEPANNVGAGHVPQQCQAFLPSRWKPWRKRTSTGPATALRTVPLPARHRPTGCRSRLPESVPSTPPPSTDGARRLNRPTRRRRRCGACPCGSGA